MLEIFWQVLVDGLFIYWWGMEFAVQNCVLDCLIMKQCIFFVSFCKEFTQVSIFLDMDNKAEGNCWCYWNGSTRDKRETVAE